VGVRVWGLGGGVECPETARNGRVRHDRPSAYTNIAVNPDRPLESVCTIGYKHKPKKPGTMAGLGLPITV